jgi:uncharacterized protein (DUF934 family)
MRNVITQTTSKQGVNFGAQFVAQFAIQSDAWHLLEPGADLAALPDYALLSLADWQAAHNKVAQDEEFDYAKYGVYLAPDQDPAVLKPWLAKLSLIAVQFPKFTDGRGYSIATLLRTRYGYTGELRAVGDVLRDQLFFMRRAGFDSYALREDLNAEKALAAFTDFSVMYQTSAAQNAPLFRRVQRGA